MFVRKFIDTIREFIDTKSFCLFDLVYKLNNLSASKSVHDVELKVIKIFGRKDRVESGKVKKDNNEEKGCLR